MSPRQDVQLAGATMVYVRAPSYLEDTATTLRPIPEAFEGPETATRRDEPLVGAEVETPVFGGRYRLGRKIGQGTFGVVHEALDTHLDRLVALKLLEPSKALDAKVVRRFVQEGRAAARVNHPAIVTVFDCGEDGGTAYIAMELLQGESLANRLQRSGRLSMQDAMELTRQLAAALHAAHEMGVIHRDLKPDNIFLVPDPAHPSGERVKILDFGLAKLRQLGVGDFTQGNQAFGTPRYMAPEQARSAGDVDRRADIYALGCILFELVCGRAPFEGEMLELFEQHQRVRAPRAHDFVPQIPQGLDTLIARMLEKAASARPATMAAVQRELQAAGALTPGVAATMMASSAFVLGGAPMGAPMGGPMLPAPAPTALQPRPAWPMPLAALHAMPSVVVTPIAGTPSNGMEVQVRPHPASHLTPQQHAPVFGPNTGMIPVPPSDGAGYAIPLAVVDAPKPAAPPSRVRKIALYTAGAAIVVTAVALLTTMALRAPESSTASATPPAAATP